MTYISLTQRVKEIETQIGVILSVQDIDNLSHAERTLVTGLKHQVIDARLEVRDYEYADTRLTQLKHATSSRKLLASLTESIIKASELSLFGAVDVAHLTAQIEGVTDALE